MRKLIVAVDVDEVCADLLGEWLRRYNERYNDTLIPEQIRGWSLVPQVKPECGNKLYDILREPGLYHCVKPVPLALAGVMMLREAGHRVVFVSSCVVGTVDDKVQWLIRHGFLLPGHAQPDFIACTDKSLINADVLIDDRVDNVESFPRSALLMSVPHNYGMKCSRQRVSSMIGAYDGVKALALDLGCTEGQTATT